MKNALNAHWKRCSKYQVAHLEGAGIKAVDNRPAPKINTAAKTFSDFDGKRPPPDGDAGGPLAGGTSQQATTMGTSVQPQQGEFSFSIGSELILLVFDFLNGLVGYKESDPKALRLSERQRNELDRAFAAAGVGATANPWIAIIAIVVIPVAFFVLNNWQKIKESTFIKDTLKGLKDAGKDFGGGTGWRQRADERERAEYAAWQREQRRLEGLERSKVEPPAAIST